MIVIKIFLTILIFSFTYSQDCDSQVCLTIEGNNLNYISVEDIAGFQFDHNGCVTGASGGDAASNGFTISTSGSTVLAFSFSGAVIPAGQGVLVNLDGELNNECLSEFVFSGVSGTSLNVELVILDEEPNFYYNLDLVETGTYQLVIFQNTMSSLFPGDEIGVFDSNGVVESCDPAAGCSEPIYGEVLVGAGVWSGSQLEISAIMSQDLSDFGGPILNGAVDNNPVVIKVWKASQQTEYSTFATWSSGNGDFGDLILAASDLQLDGFECDDVDNDGTCDEIDDCIGEYDECGVCNGNGANYECWDGSQACDLNECPEPPCDDIDDDGICDDIDDCLGEYDDCGVCNGNGANYECWDGSLVCDQIECPEEPCDAQVCLSLSGSNLNYISIEDIAGFQFNHDGCVTGASGGDAAANGFTISTSGSAVLAFSFSGSVIPSGQGTLVNLDGNLNQDCLSDFIFSGLEGASLSVAWGSLEPPCDDLDDDGICDDIDDCIGEYDECGVCNGNGSSYECWDGSFVCDENECSEQPIDNYYNVDIVETGTYQLVIFQNTMSSLFPGDEIGVFDANGVVESCDPASGCTDPVYGEVLVGSGVWNGIQLEISAIMSEDLSDFGGPILNGAVDNNPVLIRVWKPFEQQEYIATASWSAGGGDYGDLILAASDLQLEGYECSDSDDDGICDEIDDCIGIYDECGVCNGNGPSYECWDGSLVCEQFECPDPPCDDVDNDGICDDIDDCIGEYDECDVCNGNGPNYECWDGSLVCDQIECPEEPCDAQVCLSLDGTNLNYSSTESIAEFQFDHDNCATNASGGDAELNSFIISASPSTLLAFNLVGGVIAPGIGILLENVICSEDQISNIVFKGTGDNDLSVGWDSIDDVTPCDDIDEDGICDDEDDCIGEFDECGVCNGNGPSYECWDGVIVCEESECSSNDQYYVLDLVETGSYQLIIFQDTITSLDVGDEIAIFDENGVIESCDPSAGCSDVEYGEVLVGTGVWNGSQLEISAIMSEDLSDFGGPVLNGAIEDNPIYVKVWKTQQQLEFIASVTWSAGGGDFGDLILAASELSLELLCNDEDEDGICDDEDDCIGEYDECGICNGYGIPDGDCDCDGNVFDDCGVCNGDGANYQCDDGSLVCEESECDELSNNLIELPETFELFKAYPNPFNPKTTVMYSIPNPVELNISVYDIKGKIIDILYNGFKEVGYHQIIWDASKYNTGIYFIQMNTKEFNQTQKVILVK